MARSANGVATNVRQLQLVIMSMQDELRRVSAVASEAAVDEPAVQALIDTSIATALGDSPTDEDAATGDTLTKQIGIGYPDVATNYRFTTFGVDGAWESIRHRNGSTLQTTGTGQKGTVPTSLTILRSLTYTDIDPIPVP